MNKTQCMVIILTLQIILIFSYISKEVLLIKLSYKNQKIERVITKLKDDLQEKTAQHNTQQTRSMVLKQVKADGMQEIKPQQLHDLATFAQEATA